jgi:hypothetical protein
MSVLTKLVRRVEQVLLSLGCCCGACTDTFHLPNVQKQGAARYVMDIRNNGGGSFPAGVQASCPIAYQKC